MISKIQYITQGDTASEQIEAVKTFCTGGAEWVQLRVKEIDSSAWLAIAKEARAITKDFGVKLIMNDNVQLAQAVEADGVHLGKSDMPVAEARTILGTNSIIGGTANTFADVEMHVAQGADYLGFGPFRFTTTKKNLSPIVGLEGYRELYEACRSKGISIPIVAIGGIKLPDVASIIATKMHGIAISGEILHANNPPQQMKILSELVG